MGEQVLVTGSTGTVGSAVVAELEQLGVPVRAAVRSPRPDAARGTAVATTTAVRFDLAEPATWPGAFTGVETMFLVRPPAVGDVRRGLLPAVAAARDHGVRHVVFLSLQGADRLRVVPHATVEDWLRGSGMHWTFVRPSFFHQNLSTTHLADVRDRREIPVPAGDGRTAFVDAVDVGAVAARALADPAAHRDRAWTITGPEALTYHEVAAVMSEELGVPVRYTRPGALRYAAHARRTLGLPWGMVAVTTAIYTTARMGMAAGLSDDVREVLGREPTDVRAFVRRERATWMPTEGGRA